MTFNPILVWFYPEDLLVLNATNARIPFNPILVWFYRFRDPLYQLAVLAFNPILVWFYLLNSISSRTFLAGLSIPFWSDFIGEGWDVDFCSCELSIPFWSDFIIIPNDIAESMSLAFNPILVWFYPAVSLKVKIVVAFNPILVWFYRLMGDIAILQYQTFQSHFGLILSQNYSQVWYFGWIAFNPILVWFYRQRGRKMSRERASLSIPFWSDFIARTVEQKQLPITSFNPILVWFYRSGLIRKGVGRVLTFNPILVWFYRTKQRIDFDLL